MFWYEDETDIFWVLRSERIRIRIIRIIYSWIFKDSQPPSFDSSKKLSLLKNLFHLKQTWWRSSSHQTETKSNQFKFTLLIVHFQLKIDFYNGKDFLPIQMWTFYFKKFWANFSKRTVSNIRAKLLLCKMSSIITWNKV